jgi:hypothetical protein
MRTVCSGVRGMVCGVFVGDVLVLEVKEVKFLERGSEIDGISDEEVDVIVLYQKLSILIPGG